MSLRDPEGTPASSLRLLLGLTNANSVTERTLHPSLVATYRVRTVAVGALITASLLANLIVYMALDGHGRMTPTGFLVVMGLGIVALGVLVVPPLEKLLVSRWALRALYAWSVYSVLLVGVAIYVDGGGESVMYLMLPVLTVFFAIAYPQRAQLVLFTLAVAAYCVAVALRGWDLSPANLYIRIATLATVAYVGNVLSAWIVTEMRGRARSSTAAEQRAGMLEIVARAARRISSLDASQVMSGALSGAMELGAYEAEVWLLDGDPPALVLQRHTGDTEMPDSVVAAAMFERVRSTGATVTEDDGEDAVVACPIHREGDLRGVLVVHMDSGTGEDLLIIECLELLAAQASAGLDVARNVAERRELEERLAHWAFHDSLTDLPNRALFADRLELALARTARDGSNVAVLFLDLDNFKEINDTLGHGAGDELLTKVAERLEKCLRPNDTLARYGGDEFVALVEQIEGPNAAIGVARRIIEALAEPVTVAGNDVVVRTSIGIALSRARPGADADVLRRADIAMYEAKAGGGGRFVLSPAVDTERSAGDRPEEEAS